MDTPAELPPPYIIPIANLESKNAIASAFALTKGTNMTTQAEIPPPHIMPNANLGSKNAIASSFTILTPIFQTCLHRTVRYYGPIRTRSKRQQSPLRRGYMAVLASKGDPHWPPRSRGSLPPPPKCV